MQGRDRDELHRAATPLELLFDLCFVVAVAQAAARLHHGLAVAHTGPALLGYVMVFFAIWWAWMNFTWFASAYDTDDVPYRLLTFLQITGVLVLAAGVPAAFDDHDFTAVTIGYVIMRVALVAQWSRAAWEDPAGRRTDLRYAVGVSVVQVSWLIRLALPDPWGWAGFPLLVGLELAVPIWAEQAGGPTSWHPEHIAERYSLFTLIVLGEVVLAATVAVQAAAEHGLSGSLLALAAGGLLLVFGMWWIYFKRPAHPGLRASPSAAFVWGYGHYAVFAAVAALGAGLQVVVETTTHEAGLGEAAAAFAVGLPVAVFLVLVGVLQTRLGHRRFWVSCTLAAFAVIGLAAAALALPLPVAVVGMGLVTAVLAGLDVVDAHRRLRSARTPADRGRYSAVTPRRRRRSVPARPT
jgi:low temperature requirement protein LtrA